MEIGNIMIRRKASLAALGFVPEGGDILQIAIRDPRPDVVAFRVEAEVFNGEQSMRVAKSVPKDTGVYWTNVAFDIGESGMSVEGGSISVEGLNAEVAEGEGQA